MNKTQAITLITLSSCVAVSIAVASAMLIGDKKKKEISKIQSTNLNVHSPASVNESSQKLDMKNYFKNTLYNEVFPCLSEDPAYAELSGNTLIIGDLHGKTSSLDYCMNKAFEYLKQGNNVLFLGDLVDYHPERNPEAINYDASAECFLCAMRLKAMYPKQVIVLRGNHETTLPGCPYWGVGNSMHDWFGEDEDGFRKYKKCCDELPIACKISIEDKSYFCVHGGICENLDPTKYKKFKFINSYDKFKKAIKTKELQSLWNDATDNEKLTPWMPYYEKFRKVFTKKETKEFLKRVGCEKIIRGHDFLRGKVKMQDGLVATIMSDYEDDNPYDFRNRRIGYLTDEGIKVIFFGKHGEREKLIPN